MISYIKGTLVKSAPDYVIVDVSGMGYRVFIPLSTYEQLPSPGEDLKILTHFHVREDEQKLYGFATEDERSLFRMLLGVSKIGPKVALAVLGGISASNFKRAIASGDADLLASIHGIGKKTAERMIVELKDKITAIPRLREEAAKVHLVEGDQKISDVMGALFSLGYRHLQVHEAVRHALEKADPDWSVEQLLKEAFKHI